MERLAKQIEFILEMDKMKSIVRQTYLANGSRKEDDAEHSWHLTLMAFVLAEYANEPVDVLKTMKMVMLHDVIEIDAGDTYAYDEAANQTKKKRETAAADRLFSILPADQENEFRALWDEFEAMNTPEARFANTLDKIQPVLLTNTEGGSSWKEHGVKRTQIMTRNARTHEGSEELWKYIKSLIEENIRNGIIKDE